MLHLDIEYFYHANKKDEEPVVIFFTFYIIRSTNKRSTSFSFPDKMNHLD